MNLVEILGMFSRKEFALMLRCLLDRIPIIVGGNEQEFVDDFLTKICDSISIRKEIVFGTD
ncbi:hypothetical protein GF325_00795, partial [Candidatus Bathyarchaeota archaeon]|nr:hypothetical protein [Candidatus Bathyarchaeota archaeon]